MPDDEIVDPLEGQKTDVTPAPEDVAPEKQEAKEEDVTKLDLTEPEHLKTFKSSYEKKSALLEQTSTQVAELQQEIESMRASQGLGVYVDTNVPLDEFNPAEALNRMMTEEPEYYSKLADDFIANHFWPSVTEEFTNITTRSLDNNDEKDKVIIDEMKNTWDILSKRMSKGALDGQDTYIILKTLEESPDLLDEIGKRASGQSSYKPETPYRSSAPVLPGQPPNPYGNNQGFQPTNVMTIQEIAMAYNLDPSEEIDKTRIAKIQSEQQMAQDREIRAFQRDQQLQSTINQLQSQIEQNKNEQKTKQSVTDEELDSQAEQRLDSLVDEALKTDIQREYATAVPKDKPQLLTKLVTLVKDRLRTDPNYQESKKRAKGWFKQSIKAGTAADRDRWDQKGINALAAMVPIRAKIMSEEASELLGPIKKTAQDKVRKAAERVAPKEIPSNNNNPVPPKRDTPAINVGDMASAKKRIMERARNSNLLRS